MQVIMEVMWFIVGLCFGSFYHVVGSRLPKGESIFTPKHSYCPECQRILKNRDLIPLFSYLFLGGKCRYCKHKISIFYPVIEIITGLTFAVSYHVFLNTPQLYISLILASLLSIILVSDTYYLIIPDEVLIIGTVLILIIKFIFFPLNSTITHICYGIIMFISLYLIMLLGNFIFKKECLGGADIKLMFITGLVLDLFTSFCVIFIASVLALPIALFLNIKKNEKMIPYGPFLMFSCFFLYLFRVDIGRVFNFLTSVIG